jgi:hypothetical protein
MFVSGELWLVRCTAGISQMGGNFLVDRESLAYMTPERFFGHENSEFTDQYSLGSSLPSSWGDLESPHVMNPCDFERKRSLFAELESGNGDWAKRSDPFKGLVCRMLRIDPEERWPSMKVVRDILSELDIAESQRSTSFCRLNATQQRLSAFSPRPWAKRTIRDVNRQIRIALIRMSRRFRKRGADRCLEKRFL